MTSEREEWKRDHEKTREQAIFELRSARRKLRATTKKLKRVRQATNRSKR